MPGSSRIVCLDLDTFFVSVERVLNPSLAGKPVIVGGRRGGPGVVTACSYEVRGLGVRSGMSLRDASRLAPDATYLRGRGGTYGEWSARVCAMAEDVAPVVNMASIDEMYMDLRGCEQLYARPEDADGDATILRTVRELTARIASELGLPASAGIASSRSMAKVVCGVAKPAGVRLVAEGSEAAFLAPLPVRKLPGIGPVAESKLAELRLRTLGEVAAAPVEVLRGALGAWAESVQSRARGLGSSHLGRDRPAFSEHDPEGEIVGSLSNERTFFEGLGDPAKVDAVLVGLCERVCWRLRRRRIKTRRLSLKIRHRDFKTQHRSRVLPPTDSEREVIPAARSLLLAHRDPRQRLRLLGVALSKLCFDDQLALFEEDARVHASVDAIRDRFGFEAVRRAAVIGGSRRGEG
ncbi:MAG: DNA polymerase IV [Myxococcota bacterium]